MPYWRLSAFYLFYFASLGALIPYWSLYLKGLGYSAIEIGELIAILMATKLVAPNVWGWIADHIGHRMAIIRLASLLSVVAFAGVFFGQGFWWLALVMAVFSFFWNASLPQFEVTTLSHLGDSTHRYSTVRLWGSIGFILTVVGVGELLGARGTDSLLPVLMMLFLFIWVSSLAVPDGSVKSLHVDHRSLRQVLARKEVAALLLVCLLMQASHGPYYTFFTIYMEGHGYSRGLIGQLWALGVVAEIGVFLVMHRWLPRFGPRKLLLASLALTTVRWILIAAFPDYLTIILFAQILHAASFGVYHAVAIHLIHAFFVGRLAGRGQALYSSLSFGAGGALGSLASGYLWSSSGPQSTFLMAAAVSLVALVVTWCFVYERSRSPDAA